MLVVKKYKDASAAKSMTNKSGYAVPLNNIETNCANSAEKAICKNPVSPEAVPAR